MSNLSLSTLSRNALPLVPGANQGSTKGQHTDTDVRGVSTVQVPGQEYHRRGPSRLVRQARDLQETVARRAYDNTTWATAANLANLVTRPKSEQPSQATRNHTMIRAGQTISATLLTYVLGSEPRRAATRLKHSWLSSQMTDLIKLSARRERLLLPPCCSLALLPPILVPSNPPSLCPAYAQSTPIRRRAHLPSLKPTPFCAEVSWRVLASLGVSGLSLPLHSFSWQNLAPSLPSPWRPLAKKYPPHRILVVTTGRTRSTQLRTVSSLR